MGEPTNLRNFSFPILGKATKRRDAPALGYALIQTRGRLDSALHLPL